jgi:hypothetical protein
MYGSERLPGDGDRHRRDSVGILAMAFDHRDLIGDDFLADPLAFLISSLSR